MQRRDAQRCVALAAAVLALLGGCDVSSECLPWLRGVENPEDIGGYRPWDCLTGDLGLVCSVNAETTARVTVKEGSNDVVSDPGFENCDYFLCASTNGTRPYCTRKCESQLDCDPGGPPCIPGQACERDNWRCEVLIEFGALACKQIDPDTGTCPSDPATGKVRDPVKYCRAIEGHIEKGTPSDIQMTVNNPDAGM
jgi:hypothetical protein